MSLSVSDNGPGLDFSQANTVFERFHRGETRGEGSGLGLSLVKRIVEAHAGRITLTSTPGQGSTFTVSLPVLQGDPADGHDRVRHAAPQPS